MLGDIKRWFRKGSSTGKVHMHARIVPSSSTYIPNHFAGYVRICLMDKRREGRAKKSMASVCPRSRWNRISLAGHWCNRLLNLNFPPLLSLSFPFFPTSGFASYYASRRRRRWGWALRELKLARDWDVEAFSLHNSYLFGRRLFGHFSVFTFTWLEFFFFILLCLHFLNGWKNQTSFGLTGLTIFGTALAFQIIV